MNSSEQDFAEAKTCLSRVEACLAIVSSQNNLLKALITVDADGALAEARRLDPDLADANEAGKAAGLIVSLKDNIDTAGMRTTMGSRFFADNVPSEDAEVTRRVRAERAIILGKANMHEFAFGATSQNPHHGDCRNPWNPDRIPGGSSGGSGVSVAVGMCDASLGSDTGGSVRIPAALTGVVGLRPTPGRISNRGVMPSSPRFDTVGPLARTAIAAAALYEAVAGYDPRDPDSVDRPVECLEDERAPLQGAVIGVPAHFLGRAEPEIAKAALKAVDVLKELGARPVALKVEGAQEAHDQMACVARADAAQLQIERLASNPEDFGSDVLARFKLGLATTRREYAAGLEQMARWNAHVSNLLQDVDFIATPTVACAAPLIGTPDEMIARTYALTLMTFVWSFAGVPAISVPCGFTEARLPIGLQLIGRRWSEAKLLAAAAEYQAVTAHHLQRPPDWTMRLARVYR